MRETAYPIASEELEPFAALVIGRLFARCQDAEGDEDKHLWACRDLWFGMQGLNKIAIVTRTATHFSIAIQNHTRDVARYIEKHLGIDPETEWK